MYLLSPHWWSAREASLAVYVIRNKGYLDHVLYPEPSWSRDITMVHLCTCLEAWKRKEPKPKLFGSDLFGPGRGLPDEGVGAKKFGMSFETQQGNQEFLRDILGFLPAYPGGARKV